MSRFTVVLWPLLLCTACATVCDTDATALLQIPRVERPGVQLAFLESSGQPVSSHTFLGLICAVLMFTAWDCTMRSSKGQPSTVSISDQWRLIIMGTMIQVVSGSIYGVGSWQNELRDSLQITMSETTTIGAMTFLGSGAGFLGGMVFDRLGPRVAISLGTCCLSIGYCLIAIAVLCGLGRDLKIYIAASGFFLAGCASICLLHNPVCMACSISFPQNRAAVIGYQRAVLAAAAGLWALLWVQVFRDQFGLVPFLAFSAVASFLVGVASLSSMKLLPHCREPFHSQGGIARSFILLFLLTMLTFFNVMVAYRYSQGAKTSTWTGMTAVTLQMSPLLLLATAREPHSVKELGEHSEQFRTEGLPFSSAFVGLDFWLLWVCQFAVSGAGMATNQNFALILESVGHDSANSLGVSLFALTSSLTRVVVGILSDKYQAYFTRFHWLTAATVFAVTGQFFMSTMDLAGIMVGSLLVGLSYGSFYTVMVPLVNEMYGTLDFGKIWGFQLGAQAASAVIIICELMPLVYRKAANGKEVCEGKGCYQPSFVVLTVLNAIGLSSALALQVRNSDSMPVTRANQARCQEEFSKSESG